MNSRKVILSESASFDISDIVELLLANRGEAQAVQTNDALEKALASLEKLATRGRLVPELRARGIVAYREILVPPHRVIYRLDEKQVFVVAVVDHRRDLDGLLHARARRYPAES